MEISSGFIEGRYESNSVAEKPFYAFQGIPYAEPPVGKLRFQPPITPKKWSTVIKTTQDGPKCFQKSGGSEDCLYLNVFTTILPDNNTNIKLLPVMVYIHGGAFVHGSSHSKKFGPEYLIDKDIVLVTFNYRLNIFGFLNTLDASAPGNAGLKDQLAVLQWVHENIVKFGGDPQQVTIFGHSAGGSSVLYMMQSQLARGLFHRAIAQSGTTLNNWGINTDPKNLVFKLGSVLGYNSENISELISVLQSIPADQLFNVSISEKTVGEMRPLSPQKFVPSVEYNSPDAYITNYSYPVLVAQKVAPIPLLIGYVNAEAFFFLDALKTKKIDLQYFNNNPTSIVVPESLNINNDLKKLQTVGKHILNQYFANGNLINVTAFLNYETQNIFVRSIRKTIDLLRSHQDLYFYIFKYQSKRSMEYKGVTHAGELKYIFYNGAEESKEDKLTRQKITTLWTNFAKTSNPTPKEMPLLDNVLWPKLSKLDKENTKYLDIDSTLKVGDDPNLDSFEFWEYIFNMYGEEPFYVW